MATPTQSPVADDSASGAGASIEEDIHADSTIEICACGRHAEGGCKIACHACGILLYCSQKCRKKEYGKHRGKCPGFLAKRDVDKKIAMLRELGSSIPPSAGAPEEAHKAWANRVKKAEELDRIIVCAQMVAQLQHWDEKEMAGEDVDIDAVFDATLKHIETVTLRDKSHEKRTEILESLVAGWKERRPFRDVAVAAERVARAVRASETDASVEDEFGEMTLGTIPLEGQDSD